MEEYDVGIRFSTVTLLKEALKHPVVTDGLALRSIVYRLSRLVAGKESQSRSGPLVAGY